MALAPCRDAAILAGAHKELMELRALALVAAATCHSPHAKAEFDILAEILANQAESLELCAQECADIERETSWLDQYERLKP